LKSVTIFGSVNAGEQAQLSAILSANMILTMTTTSSQQATISA
jgi:hypothetical protein